MPWPRHCTPGPLIGLWNRSMSPWRSTLPSSRPLSPPLRWAPPRNHLLPPSLAWAGQGVVLLGLAMVGPAMVRRAKGGRAAMELPSPGLCRQPLTRAAAEFCPTEKKWVPTHARAAASTPLACWTSTALSPLIPMIWSSCASTWQTKSCSSTSTSTFSNGNKPSMCGRASTGATSSLWTTRRFWILWRARWAFWICWMSSAGSLRQMRRTLPPSTPPHPAWLRASATQN
mmetsp:Transcript_28183/g.76076  ORF Transcript_28183/g.76076 Transcript_28183/m.76076 type:complete len:229 (-) Transcript_28183:2760-3446(-)